MYLRPIDLTTALRPSLLPDETLLCVQDAVGLYRGKSKLPDYQNGHAYLTSHRACYVDNENPRTHCVAVSLKDVERSELYTGFIKSSPKVTLFPKAAKFAPGSTWSTISASTDPSKLGSGPDQFGISRTSTPPVHNQNATWICPICSFSNPVPPAFDPSLANETTPLQPCLTCGIKPPFTLVVKAAIAGLSNRQPAQVHPDVRNGISDSNQAIEDHDPVPVRRGGSPRECTRCTFLNHPSLTTCEMCGAPLSPTSSSREEAASSRIPPRTESPAPDLSKDADPNEIIKLSFRAGGEKVFHEQLKGALVQRKWLLQGAPPTPRHDTASASNKDGSSSRAPAPPKAVGISGLEKRDLALRRNNETVIGNAFEDLSALMASAKEIIALAESFAKQTRTQPSETADQTGSPQLSSSSSSSAAAAAAADPVSLLSQLNLTTTKDMLGSSSSGTSLYLTQLSRQIAEFLTDDRSGVGVLKASGGIISLVDLWAIFNRARGGVELVSPTDFTHATEQFEKLKLPLRLRRFKKSGLLVVQGADRTDEKTVKTLLDWFRALREFPREESEQSISSGWSIWGKGLTALEVAERFGWSVGVATEELEMAEERGALCREVAVEGVRFWENWLVTGDEELFERFGRQLSSNGAP